jgi:hypothetical protein
VRRSDSNRVLDATTVVSRKQPQGVSLMRKRRNRKTVIYDGWIEYGGESIEICNSQGYGVYKETLYAFIKQLDLAILIHKRVLVVNLVFSINKYTETNETFSKFMKNITQYLGRSYDIQGVGYQWVREHEKAKKQHYHLALILDGDRIQHPGKLNEELREKWLSKGGMHKPENCFYYIDKHNIKQERAKAIYRASYMAKSRGKQYRPDQTKDYYCSRLKYNK